MREILLTILLGIVQGLTEFLPVSSSGHLTLLSEIFGINQNNLFTSVALHFGTLMSVVVYYYKDLIGLFRKENHKTIWFIILATIPAGIVMLLIHNTVETMFSSSKYVSFGFLLTAIILLITEYIGRRIKPKPNITYKSALIIGLSQAMAIFPGISRSGSTISGGIILAGTDRKKVADFVFLMSIPIIFGSTVFEAVSVDFSSINIVATILGIIASFVTGLIAIKFMMRIIKKCNFKWFSLYLFTLFLVTFINGFIHPIW